MLTRVPLKCPHYTVSVAELNRLKSHSNLELQTSDVIRHLAIHDTGLKVYGEGKWKGKKHDTDVKHRLWWKHHIAVDTDTHEIIVAQWSLSDTTYTAVR
ncbi:transposase [Vibrio cholerae]|uniref:Transposase n=1 Tax=Vibrio cholerae TaxID=666 RepID=A0A655X346_VIBCL|nr:transposase [Vibrio cholerae]